LQKLRIAKRGVFEKTPLLKSPKTFTAKNFVFEKTRYTFVGVVVLDDPQKRRE